MPFLTTKLDCLRVVPAVGRRYLSAHSLEAVLGEREREEEQEEVRELTAADDRADELHHVLGLDSPNPT